MGGWRAKVLWFGYAPGVPHERAKHPGDQEAPATASRRGTERLWSRSCRSISTQESRASVATVGRPNEHLEDVHEGAAQHGPDEDIRAIPDEAVAWPWVGRCRRDPTGEARRQQRPRPIAQCASRGDPCG